MCILNGQRKKVEGIFMQKNSVNFDCVEKNLFSLQHQESAQSFTVQS